jgi:hypothetical protein
MAVCCSASLTPNSESKDTHIVWVVSGSQNTARFPACNVAHTYPDLDAGACGSTEPVAVGAKTESIDDVPTI